MGGKWNVFIQMLQFNISFLSLSVLWPEKEVLVTMAKELLGKSLNGIKITKSLVLLILVHNTESCPREKQSNSQSHFYNFNCLHLWLLIWISNLKLLFVFSVQSIQIHMAYFSKIFMWAPWCISVPAIPNLVKSIISFLHNAITDNRFINGLFTISGSKDETIGYSW